MLSTHHARVPYNPRGRRLYGAKEPVAPSVTVSPEEYRAALLRSGFIGQLDRLLSNLSRLCIHDRNVRATEAEAIAYRATEDKTLCDHIINGYRKLAATLPEGATVAVRGFAKIGKSPHEITLPMHCFDEVRGEQSVLEAVRQCLASGFATPAVTACLENNCHPLSTRPSVTILDNSIDTPRISLPFEDSLRRSADRLT